MTCNQTIEGNHAISIKQWKTIVSDANPELLKKAQEELNEIPGQRERDIMLFREMVLGEKNLKSPTEDAFLLKFLRVRKFNVDRAFKLLKHYYSNRLKFPRTFSTYYCPSASLNFLNDHVCIVLPCRDQLGRRIIVGRFGRWNPTLRSDDEVFASIHMCVEWALLEEETQVHGFVIIADMKHFGFTQLRYVTPSLARNFAGLLQGDLPARFKGFHIIFQSLFFELGFMILKPFLSKKIRSRIHFHGTKVEGIHDYIDPECLPEEYGGLQPSVENASELQLQALLAREDEIVKYVTNSGYNAATLHR